MKFNSFNLPTLIIITTMLWSCSGNPKTQVSEEASEETEIVEEQAAMEEADGASDDTSTPVETIAKEDSAYAKQLILSFPPIGRYAIGENYEMLMSMLEHTGQSNAADSIKGIIQRVRSNVYGFSIREYDAKNGYIQFAPNAAETFFTKVYWNKSNGDKLIGTESVGCGPVCDSSLDFQIDNGKTIVSVPFEEIIASVDDSSLIPEGYDGMDPLEFRWLLPQKGKDIKFCLDECITFKWNDGTFIQQ